MPPQETPLDPFAALSMLPDLMLDYKATAQKLIETQQELSAANSGLVSIEWIARHWDVADSTARELLKELGQDKKGRDIKVLVYGTRLVRYRKADILAITEANLISYRQMLKQKRLNRAK